MAGSRFDQAAQACAGISGRRAALRSITAAGIALVAGPGLADSAVARKRRKKKKKCKGGTKKCGKACVPIAACCSHEDCDGGSCVGGTCQCLAGVKACRGACIPEAHCCEDADCDDGNPCTAQICSNSGTCSNPHRPDLSYCGSNNLCSGGVCAAYPGCADIGMSCLTHANCCAGFCFVPPGEMLGTCMAKSDPGEPCHYSAYCNNSTCIGFVCTQ